MEKTVLNLPFDQKSFIVFGNELDRSVFQLVKDSGYYEPHVMKLLKKVITPTSICLDIGANIGLISLALSHLAKEGQVYSFEPSNTNYSYFIRTITENHIQNISPINAGVYDQNTNIKFCDIGAGGGGWSFVFDGTKIPITPNEVVPCVRLDDWIQSATITKVDFIKMDIEGSEIRALQGALNTINKYRPDLIIEFNPVAVSDLAGASPEELFVLLKSAYPNMYAINRSNNCLVKVADYSHLSEMIKSTTHEDLYCTFKEPVSLGF